MMVKINDTCTACGLCCDTCPEVFEMGSDMAEVLLDEIPEDLQPSVEQAAEECPVGAIEIDEE